VVVVATTAGANDDTGHSEHINILQAERISTEAEKLSCF